MTDSKEEGEKLFSAEKSAADSTAEATKFVPETESSKNGLSPITVENVKSKFTGLTKEELMKYVNDPFWVRIRWFLFIMFWFIWFLMLFGAIYVVIVTPKCTEPPPPVWWQRSPLYKVDIRRLAYSGNDSAIGNA